MNPLFIVLVFIIVIAIVIATDIITTVQILSLLASVAVVYRCFSDNSGAKPPADSSIGSGNVGGDGSGSGGSANDTSGAAGTDAPLGYPPDGFYGRNYDDWRSFTAGYGGFEPPSFIGGKKNIDDVNLKYGILRSRDKKCIEGAVTKTADYYKYHFADELVDYESRPWWGRNEY